MVTVPSSIITKILLNGSVKMGKPLIVTLLHGYNTRFKTNFQYPRTHLKRLEKTPSYIR